MKLRTALTASAVALAAAFAGTAAMAPAAPAQQAAKPEQQVSVHWSEADGITAGMATTTTSTATYKFTTLVNSKPVRWNPCQVIHWRYNPAGQPSWLRSDGSRYYGFDVIRSAMAKVSTATGIRWVYDGKTTSVPTSKWLPTSVATIRPVLIGWTDGAHSDLLASQPASTLAVTRTAYFKTVVDGVTLAATKGMAIAFDRTNKLPGVGNQSWRSVALHELSHGMGLSHVGTTSQVMYPMLTNLHRELQSGDLAGLSRLGRSQGCINLGF
jgi:hypothetical protein